MDISELGGEQNIEPGFWEYFGEGTKSTYFFWFSCILILVLSWYGVLIQEGEKPDEWFQNSGSFVTFLAIVVQLRFTTNQYAANNFIFNYEEAYKSFIGAINKIDVKSARELESALKTDANSFRNEDRNIAKVGHKINFVLILVGTMVWGYGDILHRAFVYS